MNKQINSMDPLNVTMVEDLLCDESFQRFCRGEQPADVQYWEQWINANSNKQALVAHAKQLFEVLNGGQGNRLEQLTALKDAVARRSRFKQELLNRPAITNDTTAKVIPFNNRSLFKYAAAVIILLTAGTLAYITYTRHTPAAIYAYEYTTGVNERKTIMLPDSSTVMLNGNSHLSISRHFNAHHRQVAVTGEAFFNVYHDAANPFLVNTKQYTIRVLGTTFNVKSYPGTDTTATTLIAGKIEIIQDAEGKEAPGVVLKPNQKFVLAATPVTGIQTNKEASISNGAVVTPVLDVTSRHLVETSWARNKMEIKDKTLLEIAEKLQAWYGIKIRFADEAVKDYRYTAVFNDETIFSALQYLQQSYPFTYSINNDCIVIAKS
jgi:ferric-dicitrate binding protein FerR (iron transport regulator)